MSELLLTLDTSTPAGSVAISRGEHLLGEVLLETGANHTDRLLQTIHQLLADLGLGVGEMDAFGVVLGPGSFTGLRVGIATVKGLALATGRPAAGVSSLATLAAGLPFVRFPVCALLDARKKEVYAGLFDCRHGRPQPLEAEVAVPPERLLARLTADTVFVGNGAEVYRTLIIRHLGPHAHFAPWPLVAPRAALAALLVLDRLRAGEGGGGEALLPRYLRLAEAELAWLNRQAAGAIDG